MVITMSPEYQETKEWFLRDRSIKANRILWAYGWGIIHWACCEDDWEFIVWLVLYRGADPNFSSTSSEYNALGYAEDFKVIKFLLWQGCDPYQKDKYGTEMVYYHHYELNYDYISCESSRIKILVVLHQNKGPPLHKDLWREVGEWLNE